MSTELHYTKEHEWVKLEDGKAYVGVTDHAQSLLGDIVFVDLPEVGCKVSRGDVLGTIESVKTVSDVFAPISGTVVEVNTGLEDSPALVNSDPYASFLAVLEISNETELNDLLDEAQYLALCKE